MRFELDSTRSFEPLKNVKMVCEEGLPDDDHEYFRAGRDKSLRGLGFLSGRGS